MVSLGFMTALFPEGSWEEMLAIASELGYECVELACWPRGAGAAARGPSHLDVDALNESTHRRIAERCREQGVSISALGYYPNMLAEDEKAAAQAREHFQRVVDAAAALEIGLVNTFIGRPRHAGLEESFERMRSVWPGLLRYAEERGVYVGIENCPLLFTADDWPGGGNLAYSPPLWRRIFEELPSPYLGLNYDPSHLLWQQIDPVAPLAEFGEKLFHLHLKDARIRRERLKDVGILASPLDYHVPRLPGLGDIDWGRFFGVVNDTGYRGAACVEVEDPAFEGSDAKRRAALLQCRNYLSQYLPLD
jgi:sugar phosphate isomerase/epimerase